MHMSDNSSSHSVIYFAFQFYENFFPVNIAGYSQNFLCICREDGKYETVSTTCCTSV